MADPTVIVHGWSDCSTSFRHLKSFLAASNIGAVSDIYYADYESREDNVTFEDVVGGLDDALRGRGLIDADGKGSFNVIVHSTGGLVIRHWLWRYYRHDPASCPVKNLVMLAPANFGSPLAHRGKSFLGQLVKGRWKIGDMLEVGRDLLHGLELASPYQWELAHRDLLGPKHFYDPERVRLTVLVGIEDYRGIRGWVNKPGTDGTVVIAGTPLNTIKVTLDFVNPTKKLQWKIGENMCSFAFGVLPGYDHGSIVGAFQNHRTEPSHPVIQLLESALKVNTPKQFERHCERVSAMTKRTYDPASWPEGTSPPPQYQQFILHAVDDQGASIRDFTIEFFVRRADRADDANSVITSGLMDGRERALSDDVDKLMASEFHTHGSDASFRRILIDAAKIAPLIPEGHLLAMRMHVPKIDRGIYYDTANTQDVILWDPGKEDGPQFFFPNTTTLVELVVDRVTQYVTLRTTPKDH